MPLRRVVDGTLQTRGSQAITRRSQETSSEALPTDTHKRVPGGPVPGAAVGGKMQRSDRPVLQTNIRCRQFQELNHHDSNDCPPVEPGPRQNGQRQTRLNACVQDAARMTILALVGNQERRLQDEIGNQVLDLELGVRIRKFFSGSRRLSRISAMAGSG